MSDVTAVASDAGASPAAFLWPIAIAVGNAIAAGAGDYLHAHPGWLAGIIVMVLGGIIDGLKTRFVMPVPFITEGLKLMIPPLGRWVEANVTAWLDSIGKKGNGKALVLLLALLVGAQPAQAYPSETLRLPPTTVQDFRFLGEVADRPTIVAGYLLEFAPRAPWLTSCYGSIFDLQVWQDERPDCPASLRTLDASGNVLRHGGNAYWFTSAHNGRVELNAQYLVRACLAHELGHVEQHREGVLQSGHPDSTPEGRLMYSVWCGLPGPDDEEAFANTVRDHLLGATWSPFVRWFPTVLALWRPRCQYIGSPVFATENGASLFQWWDGGRLQLERLDQYGRHLRFDSDSSTWIEVTP